ncbi:MAG: DNA-binding response regulator [Bacteroidota bacterium]
METIHCIIVDDEPLAIKVIESHLKEFRDFDVIASCRNAPEAFEVLRNHSVDLIFLDIEMPKLDGISFLKSLKNPPLVLITTAHRKFAPEGFELDVVDYLLKPISLDRFMQAIAKVQRSLQLEVASFKGTAVPNTHIFVKSERENVKIDLMDIHYVESLKNHVKIVTPKKNYITMISISEMQAKLPNDTFIRVHRSYLVNTRKIQNYTNTYLVINGTSFPLGNVYKNSVLKKLDKNRI